MTSLKYNDPRITAYALGELEGEEKSAFEKEMVEDVGLNKEVRELRRLSILVADELKNEPALEFSPEQRNRILPAPSRPVRARWAVGFGLGSAIAAGLIAFLMMKPPIQVAVKSPEGEFLSPQAAADLDARLANPKKEVVAQVVAQRKVLPKPRFYDATGGTSVPIYADAPASRGTELNGQLKGVGGGTGYSLPATKPSKNKSHSYRNNPVKPQATFDREGEAPRMERDETEYFHQGDPMHTEGYSHIEDNPFIGVGQDPRSTFSIDVDTAAYANMRRFILGGQRPPPDAVRIEELINYFPYSYSQPTDDKPFAVHTEVAQTPWNREHKLVRIALKGKEIPWDKRPSTNLVFLIDVSGSMNAPNRLPLVVESLKLLVERLTKNDRVAIVVYAGASGLVLPSTSGSEKNKILEALDRLQAGGSTNGGAGIELAYKTAKEHFIKGGANRVILATDGDFNVGTTSEGELIRLIQEKAKTGVFLSVLGYGMGNYKDSNLEKIADKGHGNYAYIDTLKEANKVLNKELGGTLYTIAKDVKIQVEFNPAQVGAFRLIGYENRVLQHQDFNDDKKDAGDIGSGHTVTALYEIVPKGKKLNIPGVDALKYQTDLKLTDASGTGELMTVKLRYKKPDGDKSDLLSLTVADSSATVGQSSADFRFATAVASFGMILRDSKYKGSSTFDEVLDLATSANGQDELRSEFIELVKKAKALPK